MSSRGRRRSGFVRGPGIFLSLLVGLTCGVVVLLAVVRYRAGLGKPLPVLGQVEGFQLTNQHGVVFSSASLGGTPWVADLIFTRCPGPCLKMTRNLVQLQQRTQGAGLQLVTLTADPVHDVPAVLRGYADKLGARHEGWQFLTGERALINRVAMQQLLLALEEKDPSMRESEEDLYLHSTKWVLVDGAGRLRAVYEGTEPESVNKVLGDLRRLRREEGR